MRILQVKNRSRASGRAALWVIVAVFFVLFFLTIGPGLLEPAFVLAFGWAQFLHRTMSAISWNWDLVGMGVVASIVILFLVQKVVGGVFDKVAVSRNASWRWSWRWTWTGFVSLLILFLVGMAVGGIAHQVGWMMSTKEPMMQSKRGKWRDYANMKQLDVEIRMALEDESGDVEKARMALRDSPGGFLGGTRIMEMYHVLLVQDADNKVIGRLIFPRDGLRREAMGGYSSFDSGGNSMCPWSTMLEIVKTNRAKLIAL